MKRSNRGSKVVVSFVENEVCEDWVGLEMVSHEVSKKIPCPEREAMQEICEHISHPRSKLLIT